MDRGIGLIGQLFRFRPELAENPPVTPCRPNRQGARKVALTLAMTAGLLLVGEAMLQVRSHFTSGDSVFTMLFADSRYIDDKDSGLQLLRPNQVFLSNGVTMRSNSLGLRSPEIPIARTPGSWRIAVVGASTVMGVYAPDSDRTFPGLLEQRLRQEFPRRQVEVVNAGIVGYGLDEQRRMLEKRVALLQPDITVVYTGFNDFLAYCLDKSGARGTLHRQGLPLLTLPSWLMSVDMLKKNTVPLRTTAAQPTSVMKPEAIDLAPYRAKLEALVQRAAELKLPLVFATNAKAYRRDQPLDEQMRLSETDRYYNHCFDVPGLHVLYERHNAEIRAVARAHGIPVIDLERQVPGGARYFADSHHFSAEGENLVAERLAGFIIDNKLLPN